MMSHSSTSSYPYPYLILDPRCLARTEEDRAKVPLVLYYYSAFSFFYFLCRLMHTCFSCFFLLSFSFSLSITLCLSDQKKKERDRYSVVSYSSVIQGVASFSSSLLFRHSHVHDSTRVDFVIGVDEQSMTVGLGRRCRMSHDLDRRVTLERQRKRYESCKSRKGMPIDTASFQRPWLYLSPYFYCWPCSSTFLDRTVPFCSRVPVK